jgi:membrane-associated phospholipid phosphatase
MIASAAHRSWFPGWRHLGRAVNLAIIVLIAFCVVYGGADYLSRGRTLVKVHFDAELSIPFVPAMTLAYVSMYGLFVLAPFLLRTKRELRALAGALIASILVAGVCFLLWPAEAAFPEPEDLGIWAGLYHAADRINLRYNMVPSLHVALSIATVSILARRGARWFAAMLWNWGALISLSTLLMHQHHLLDVATGAVLGIAVDHMVFRRTMSHARCEVSSTTIQPAARRLRPVGLAQPSAQKLQANPAQDRTPSA